MVIVITSILVSFIYVLYQLEIRAIPAIHLDSLLETGRERERDRTDFFFVFNESFSGCACALEPMRAWVRFA